MENAKGRLAAVLDWLPARLGREIESVARGSRHSIREIRLRASGISSVVTDGGDFPLFTRVTHAELEGVVDKRASSEPLFEHEWRVSVSRATNLQIKSIFP